MFRVGSEERERGKGKALGLVLTAALLLAGLLDRPAGLIRPARAEENPADILPSVMVGACGTEAEETEGALPEGRAKSQVGLWLRSLAEGLDHTAFGPKAVLPRDASREQTLSAAASLDSLSDRLMENHRIMSDQDYQTLLAIVEAECTGGDEKSKLLVADVILNRMRSSQFPNSVYEVVYQREGATAQFSPTQDGRMGTLPISDTTRSAVSRAVGGEDLSQGALFFMARASSKESNVEWFDDALTYLFSYGGHDFYTFK